MDINFAADFNNTGSTVSTGSNYLEKNKIHTVKIKEIKEGTVTTRDKGDLNVLIMVFEDEAGKVFEDKTFEITQESTERKEGQYGLQASKYDATILKYKCYLENFAPKLYEKIIKGEKVLKMKTWKQFKDTMISIFSQVANLETPVWCKLKLVDSKGFASLPFFANISKEDGKPYVSNNFIGNVQILKEQNRDIAFTSKELAAIEKKAEAAQTAATSKEDLPTTIGNEDVTNVQIAEEDFEVDL